jgi:excisionase family DNA binding protein
MPVPKEDFEAGNYGDELHRVMECLPADQALTEKEIQAATKLDTKSLNYARAKLLELGWIQRKWLGAAEHYLKVAAISPQEWCTIDEAASHLRVSRRTIYQLLQDGQLASYRVGKAGHRRFKREDLDRVMQKEAGEEIYAMSAVADPVLAELWDNEKDAEYDRI